MTNRQTIEDLRLLSKRIPERPAPPQLAASTLVAPGHIEAEEVGRISSFVASLDQWIPYNLLAFHPRYEVADLLPTSPKQAQACPGAARQATLTRIRVGNQNLLW